jgi:hypothetical protein
MNGDLENLDISNTERRFQAISLAIVDEKTAPNNRAYA